MVHHADDVTVMRHTGRLAVVRRVQDDRRPHAERARVLVGNLRADRDYRVRLRDASPA